MMSVFTLCLFGSCPRDITLGYHEDWWEDSVVTEPEPHLKLMCLATENNGDVIGNLPPCAKNGKQSWLSSLNSICRPSLQWISDSTSTNSQRFPFGIASIPVMCPLSFFKMIFSFLDCNKMTNNLCGVTNGCNALWAPIKTKPSAKWAAVGR